MTPSQIAKHVKANKSIKRWALSTQRKQVLYVKAFFHYLVHDCKEISEDPTRYLNMHRYVDDKPTQKNNFKKTDIHTLFERSRMSQLDNPLHYFGSLLACYTAMRCNEIAQLLVHNIQMVEMLDEDGNTRTLHCIEVTDSSEGQSVKSAYSRRMVPIHSKLIKAGFLEYVEAIRNLGCKELFPGTSWAGTGPGHVLSKWFNGEFLRKQCGITAERTTLRSFRGNLNTLADRNRVPEGVMVSINGHSNGTDVRRKHYVSRADALECQNYLEKLPFPELDLPPYNFGQFKDYVTRAITRKESLERRIQEGVPLPPKRGRKAKEDWYDDPVWSGQE
jgi:integrase